MEFVRWGGLSLTNQKERYKMNTFHSPPCKRGIYCFDIRFIEPFLYKWKENHKHLDNKKRTFKYSGDIWTHFYFEKLDKYYSDHKKDWYLTHTKYLEKIIGKEIATRNRDASKFGISIYGFSRHRWKGYTKDEFEFFISNKV